MRECKRLCKRQKPRNLRHFLQADRQIRGEKVCAKQTRQAVQAAPSKSLSPVKPRRVSHPWSPSPAGPYRLPRSILDRLAVSLAQYRNRDAALDLAVFLARYWSSPARLAAAFPIDRRALADHATLGLSEARVRGAIAALEAVGFLDRAETLRGSRYQPTETGLHRKPILFRFGVSYRENFAQANARTRARRAVLERRPAPVTARKPVPKLETPATKVAQKQNLPGKGLFMGEQNLAPLTGLEAALERLRRATGMVDR